MRYRVIPKGDDAVWIQRGRFPGDKFHGTQIAFEVWGNEEELRILREAIDEINHMEEMAQDDTTESRPLA